jgi:hypothetical protein
MREEVKGKGRIKKNVIEVKVYGREEWKKRKRIYMHTTHLSETDIYSSILLIFFSFFFLHAAFASFFSVFLNYVYHLS